LGLTGVIIIGLVIRLAPQLGLAATAAGAAVAWYLASWTGYAAAAVAVQGAVGITRHPAAIAGGACLAWAVGFLAVLAPSGAA
jgi:hypothetical protein